MMNHIGEQQVRCKEWLVNNLPVRGRGVVLGGWYGMLANQLGFVSNDIDSKCEYYGKLLFPNVKFNVDNAFNHLMTCRYDVIVSTSCEHMDQVDLDMLNYMETGTWLALQSNNWEGVGGHINCKSSLEEFVSEYDLDVHYQGEQDMGEYNRFMLIGRTR